ncbi:MAG TPA: hypothetical protein VNO70_11995 [Blastocatellia bacterium]|nr:hypothetical protein [Blastocatellia bacterium]
MGLLLTFLLLAGMVAGYSVIEKRMNQKRCARCGFGVSLDAPDKQCPRCGSEI